MFSVSSQGVSFVDCAFPNHIFVSPQREMAWDCYKCPNGCCRGRVREVCYKEGSDVAPMGTESATVLWSRDVSGRIKEHEGVCSSMQRSLCDPWQFARSGFSRTALFIQLQVLQLWGCIGSFRPRKSCYRGADWSTPKPAFLNLFWIRYPLGLRMDLHVPLGLSVKLYTPLCVRAELHVNC
jgi:hypothetical protein